MQRLRPYSKAIAAPVSAIVGFVAVHFSELDSALLEAAILMVLTAAGVYVAPANQPKPPPPPGSTMRTPWPIVVLALIVAGLWGCASYTFNDISGAFSKAVSATANSVRRECGNAEPGGPCVPGSLISTEDRDELRARLLVALDARDMARDAWRAGEQAEAFARLRAAQAILDQIEQYLIERGVK